MEELQREIDRLDRKLREAKKQAQCEKRAKETAEFAPKVTEETVNFLKICCGNCGETFAWGRYLIVKTVDLPNFCSKCGAKVEKGGGGNGSATV